jgi:tetratricopeptide (TPR) repeat protein
MIGRSAQLESIIGQVDAMCALAHARNVLFVTGEAGMGKTTLLRTLEERLSTRRGPGAPLVVSTECSTPLLGQDVGQVEALEPWAELLERILRHDGNPGSKKEMVKLLSSVAVAWCHCVPVVGGMIGSSIETAMLVKEHADEKEKAASPEQMFQQYINFLGKASEAHPLVLLLDDFHWADTSSTNLLFAAARHLAKKPVLFVIAYRPDDAASSRGGQGHPLLHVRNELGRYSLYSDVVVPKLTTADLGGLLRGRYANYQTNDAFERWLVERSGGNTLFITQYLNTLEEDGIISENTGELKARFDAVRVPNSASSVVEERIRRLDDDARELLRYASVEGATFTVGVLAALAETPKLRLLSTLRMIGEKHGVIKSLGKQRIYASESTTYQFTNVLMQRVLYESLEDEEREELHARVYRTIRDDQTQVGDTSSSVVGLAVRLAAHAATPEERHYAARLLLEAARASWTRCAEEETLGVLAALGDDLDGLEAARLVFNEPSEREVRELQGEAALLTGLVHKFRGRHALAIESFGVGATRFDAAGLPTRALEALMRRAFTYENARRYEEALAYSGETLTRAEAQGDRRVHAAMLNNIGLALAGLGRVEEALKHQHASLALREQDDDLVGQAVSLGSIGLALFSLGRNDEALAHHQRALALREELGDRVGQGYSLTNLANVLASSGRLDEALAFYRRSVEVRDSCGDVVRQTDSLEGEARLLARLGRPADAIERLEQALRLREALGDPRAEAAALVRLATLVLEQGDASRCRRLVQRAIALASEGATGDEARALLGRLPVETAAEPAPTNGGSTHAPAPGAAFSTATTPPPRHAAEPAEPLPWLVQAAIWVFDKVERR